MEILREEGSTEAWKKGYGRIYQSYSVGEFSERGREIERERERRRKMGKREVGGLNS